MSFHKLIIGLTASDDRKLTWKAASLLAGGEEALRALLGTHGGVVQKVREHSTKLISLTGAARTDVSRNVTEFMSRFRPS